MKQHTDQPSSQTINATSNGPSKLDIMGIVNVTPDSFSDGGQFLATDAAMGHIEKMIEDGASIIDIGAESTRPGSEPVSIQEEMRRLTPILRQYHRHFSVPLSLDTTKPEVVELGLEYNVAIINSVQPIHQDPRLMATIKDQPVDVVLMHMVGTPKTMQDNPVYDDIIQDMTMFFKEGVLALNAHTQGKIILDPGIGFGKTVTHNTCILNQLQSFKQLDCPLMVGVSNKSFLGAISGRTVSQRLVESVTAQLIAVEHGASIIRCHDPGSMQAALSVMRAIKDAS